MERKLEIKSLELKVGSGRESRVIFSGIDAVAEKAQFIALVGANRHSAKIRKRRDTFCRKTPGGVSYAGKI